MQPVGPTKASINDFRQLVSHLATADTGLETPIMRLAQKLNKADDKKVIKIIHVAFYRITFIRIDCYTLRNFHVKTFMFYFFAFGDKTVVLACK